MDIQKITAIRDFYSRGATFDQIKRKFKINDAQAVAICIISSNQVSSEVLLSKIDEITPGMNFNQIRLLLGLSPLG